MKDLVFENTLEFFSNFEYLRVPTKTIIVLEGKDLSKVYFIKSGFVRMFLTLPRGNELTLHVFKPGSFFSMITVLCDIPNVYGFESIGNCELFLAPIPKFKSWLSANPEILQDLTIRAFRGIAGLIYRLQLFSETRAEPRVKAAIDYLSQYSSYTHMDVSKVAGLTREATTVSIGKISKSH